MCKQSDLEPSGRSRFAGWRCHFAWILGPISDDPLAALGRTGHRPPIRYSVQGFVPGKTSLFVYLGEPGSSREFELPLATASGVVRLADHPMLSGRKTLTFKLALGHQPLENAEARVVLRSMVIEGERGAA